MTKPDIFLSYNRQDAARAKVFAESLTAEGFDIWWDAQLRSGEEYDRVTETALRGAKAVVVLWSKRSVESSWVRAEATQGLRNKTLMPAMIEDCIRPVMFELTQTADLANWSGNRHDPAWRAFVADLREQVGHRSPVPEGEPVPVPAAAARKQYRVAAAAAGVVLALAATAWLWLRPSPAAAHDMTVRLSGFELLSPDLPDTLPATTQAEIAAAFNSDGIVRVSTSPTKAARSGPAYALGGTIRHEGEAIRVITNVVNETTGATLWSSTFDYPDAEAANVPRHIAVDAGNVVRCGLFGASTYGKPLPDAAMGDYLQFCQGYWDPNLDEGRRALIPAERVVAALPDFSWGWAAVAGAYWKVAGSAADKRIADEARARGREAADRAISIDERNSEAMFIKAKLVERHDWMGQEALYKRALAARRLDCGCERHQYGEMLASVGRTAEAVEQLHQANDMLALYIYTPLSLANALLIDGKSQEAGPVYDAAMNIAPNARFAAAIASWKAAGAGDVTALQDAALPLSAAKRAALTAGFRALQSGDAAAKMQAAVTLRALPDGEQSTSVVWLLADLGATDDALRMGRRLAWDEYPGPSLFWHPSMRLVRRHAAFPGLVKEFALMDYWKASKTKPDVCNEPDPALFCRII